MDHSEITKLARLHTQMVSAIPSHFEAISKQLIASRGSISGVEAADLFDALAKIPDIDGESRKVAAGIAEFARSLPGAIARLNEREKRIVSAIEGVGHRTSAEAALNEFRKLREIATDEVIAVILDFEIAMLEDGMSTLYDPRAFAGLIGLDRDEGNAQTVRHSVGGAVLEDVAGAAVGGAAGAVGGAVVTWWAGSGPGAVAGGLGGAASGAIMFSGKYAWEATKKWWDGTYHGENDPVGPIGGGGLPDGGRPN